MNLDPFRCTERRIVLVGNDGEKNKFMVWGEWFHRLYLYRKRVDDVSFQKITFAGHYVACKQNTY